MISSRRIVCLQVRLQEIWRDRREELSIGVGRVEQVGGSRSRSFRYGGRILADSCSQHYEHLLNETSTEISELEGSINLKYQAITKLQVIFLLCFAPATPPATHITPLTPTSVTSTTPATPGGDDDPTHEKGSTFKGHRAGK